jgi:transcriptional regulator with XRE-family HTH domain
MDLPMVLITVRQEAGLSQQDVHWHYRIDQSQLSDLERGRVSSQTGRAIKPHASTLRRLAMAYAQHIAGVGADLIFQLLIEARDRGVRRESHG